MLFNSYEFLFVFLPLVLFVYHRVLPVKWQTAFLTIASYVFYGWWDARFCLLLFASTAIDYCVGLRLARTDVQSKRRAWLGLSLVSNLGILGFFKYAGFAASSVNALAGSQLVPVFTVVLPVGISFYTFQSLSYSIDVYRGNVEPVRNFADFACYVSLFSQLVAGPIVRFTLFRPQLETRTPTAERAVDGIHLFIIGLAKKTLIADSAALVADPIFAGATPGFGMAWLGAAAYAIQIYFDFSGYSDMAVGLGKMFGFEFPQNFDSPYSAHCITDFWRRWHMSLSTWLRDYLYIPLGGNRKGAVRTYVNLFITMLLGGLWHGASWTFVAWGAYHGVLLAVERMRGIRAVELHARRPTGLAYGVRVGWTSAVVVFGWVLFRCETLTQALHWWTAMLGLHGFRFSGLPTAVPIPGVLLIPFAFVACWLLPNSWEWRPRPSLRWAVPMCALAVVTIAVCITNDLSPFLYFQF